MVDRLLAWLRSLPQRFLNWWEKFTARQKIAIISLAVAVIAAAIILIAVISKPTYVTIYNADTPKEAQDVIDLLVANDIAYQTSIDGLEITINQKDYTTATLLLGSNNIYTEAFGINNVTDGGFSTTEADKQKKYIVYLERLMKDTIESCDFVKTATVQLNIPEDDGTMIAKNTESSASIMLELKDECSTDAAAGLARFVATALGNDTTKNITILDTEGRMLFSGTDENSTFGTASNQLALQSQIENLVADKVKRTLLASKKYSSIEVAPNIVLDNSYTEESEHLYWPDGDKDQGVLASADIYQSNNEGGVSGIPGTDSNTETTYQYEDSEYSSSSTTEESYDYLPNEKTTLKQIPAGSIDTAKSSITVTCHTYNVIREEDAKSQGLLDGTTWDAYKLANQDSATRVDIEDDIYSAVSTATGIDIDDITIIAYQEPMFVDKEGLSFDSGDILQVVLILLILGLLAFVILRSMKSAKVEEEEPEISIEEILKSTPPEELEEIGVEEKSEARKIVDKFVEDNPDAAANLLRNWLNEDWS